jgi:hypothetical protein
MLPLFRVVNVEEPSLRGSKFGLDPSFGSKFGLGKVGLDPKLAWIQNWLGSKVGLGPSWLGSKLAWVQVGLDLKLACLLLLDPDGGKTSICVCFLCVIFLLD